MSVSAVVSPCPGGLRTLFFTSVPAKRKKKKKIKDQRQSERTHRSREKEEEEEEEEVEEEEEEAAGVSRQTADSFLQTLALIDLTSPPLQLQERVCFPGGGEVMLSK